MYGMDITIFDLFAIDNRLHHLGSWMLVTPHHAMHILPLLVYSSLSVRFCRTWCLAKVLAERCDVDAEEGTQ